MIFEGTESGFLRPTGGQYELFSAGRPPWADLPVERGRIPLSDGYN